MGLTEKFISLQKKNVKDELNMAESLDNENDNETAINLEVIPQGVLQILQ